MTPRLRPRDDQGNIVLALLGILIITSIIAVTMTQVVIGAKLSRHDRNRQLALTAAETGLSRMVTLVKAAPYASAVSPVSGSDSSTSTSWSATASGGSGHWVVKAVGSATGSASPVTRTLTQQVDVTDLLAHPLFGVTSLTVGGGAASSVDTYDSAADSSVCSATGTASTMGSTSTTRMCTHASPAQGRAGTNGPLTFPSASLGNVDGLDVYAAGVPGYPSSAATGSCAGDATTCASGKVATSPSGLSFPLSSQCANGIGAGAAAYDGSLALAANAVYSFTDVTLNATAIANLANLSGSTLVICFSGTLDVVPTVPVNSTVQTLLPLRLAPRAPSTLVLISTSGTPKVRLNAGLTLPSSLSAVVYAPNAACTASAHVDLYGALVCGTVSAPAGIDVHYDTEVGKMPFDQPVSVSRWREQ